MEIISTRDCDRKKNSNLNMVNFFHFQFDMLYFSHTVVNLSFSDDLCLTDISRSVLLEPINALLTRDVFIRLLLPWTWLTRDVSVFIYVTYPRPQALVSAKIPWSIMSYESYWSRQASSTTPSSEDGKDFQSLRLNSLCTIAKLLIAVFVGVWLVVGCNPLIQEHMTVLHFQEFCDRIVKYSHY